ncbi:helix-turn-helix transcriptional regulator [Pseudonocardia lacus]|uniref:helix-turn-helix transcriptional regulator n=1 Tax=Pseudonocardia lacus TaxID=2835865 RepID=UPI001BDBC501|nr:helix-turn-helix transcriptional regulator [Pseudonocardia lacus]
MPSAIDALLSRTISEVSSASGLPVVFGGPVARDGLLLTTSTGMRTASLDRLLVARDHGLGGRAAQVRRPVSVTDYRTASVISHAYDREVAAEGLVSMVAVPVLVDRTVRAVLYGALRRPGPMGDAPVDVLTAAAARLARRMTAEPAPPAGTGTRSRLAAVFDELHGLADRVGDPALRTEIEDGCRRFAHLRADRPGRRAGSPRTRLSARELDVLALAATGCGNDLIADLLDTTPDAVKAHLRRAMRGLGARSRQGAVSAARAQGLLP